MNGLKNDVSKGYHGIFGKLNAVADAEEARKQLPEYDGECPPVSIRPDLRTMVEFYTPEDPEESEKISEITIASIKNTCRIEDGGVVMQIDFNLIGKAGPKARVKPTDQPSFAYPYFVAVTDMDGNVLSKEIFAAPVAYEKGQNTIEMTESVFQKMPLPENVSSLPYKVIVGFQLSEEQLAYNHARATSPATETNSKVGTFFSSPILPSKSRAVNN